MFVKILKDRGQTETTYDCDRKSIEPVKETFDKIQLELGKIEIVYGKPRMVPVLSVVLECSDLEIITMNNDGKTVDRKVLD